MLILADQRKRWLVGGGDDSPLRNSFRRGDLTLLAMRQSARHHSPIFCVGVIQRNFQVRTVYVSP